MSFREWLQKVVSKEAEPIEEHGKELEALPAKSVFADGLCGVCGQAMHTHPENDGVKYDCNGTPLEFKDEPQEIVKAREAKP